MRFRELVKLSDFAAVPVAILILSCSFHEGLLTIAAYILGFFGWTFIEYWMHRALHRGCLRIFHMRHHQHPHDLSGGTLYSTAIIAALVIIGWLWPWAAPIATGILLGYFWFIYLHLAFHHDASPDFMPGLQMHHAIHHRDDVERCFGVSTRLWDRCFHTLQETPCRCSPSSF